MSFLDNLQTPAQIDAEPFAERVKRLAKGQSRLEKTVADRPLVKVDDKTFKLTVRTRDKNRCRWCERKVLVTMARVPERAEVHHIHGRGKDLRFEDKAAICLCAQCHEKVTGKVNEKWIIVATKTFKMRDQEYTDAREKVMFQRVA